jgi:urea transporter
MTMLTHLGGPFKRAPYSSGKREAAVSGTAQAHLAVIKRFGICVLMALLVGSAVAGVMALKAAVFLSRFNYH